MDLQSFYKGTCFDAYEEQGCQYHDHKARFCTYAPNAQRVALIGEFSYWCEIPMERCLDGNFWECTVGNINPGQLYQYRIYQKDGIVREHCDPYGYGMELRPGKASVVRDINAYQFHDESWMKSRTDCKNGPLNIYEMHAGSWRQKKDEVPGWYNYRELAQQLIPYLKEMGYNYVELMPLGEHPCDESWGYQETCFYSPTSRYGTCEDLQFFVDFCHMNQIGVILDFVPVHFAVDGYGLAMYDGSFVYEYAYDDVGYNEWGSKNFNHGKGEVRSFLQSNANYWLEKYHFDGLRMDAISNMIYWQGNQARGENKNAVEFIRRMNEGLKMRHQGIILAAEDSTSYPGVTRPVFAGGMGFDYKWDMGWMHDTLEYFQVAPIYRVYDYHKLTFSMMYFNAEYYMLPLSHDEVVHGKATILQKMNGFYEDKFSEGRAMYMYMYVHPGKKLNFMGNEIGQLREWDEKREQDWDMLMYPRHDSFCRFMKDLNALYLSHSEMWERDYEQGGFWWADCSQEERRIYSIVRSNGKKKLLAVFNFSDLEQKNYVIAAEKLGGGKKLKLVLDSEWEKYNGVVPEKEEVLKVDKKGNFTIDLVQSNGKIYQIEE